MSGMASYLGQAAFAILSTYHDSVQTHRTLLISHRTRSIRRRSRRWYRYPLKPHHEHRAGHLIHIAEPDTGQKEIFASWSLFILIMLLISALFTSYVLQTRKIQAVHETVISIFAGTLKLIRDCLEIVLRNRRNGRWPRTSLDSCTICPGCR